MRKIIVCMSLVIVLFFGMSSCAMGAENPIFEQLLQAGGTAMRSGRGIDALSQDDRETLEWLAKHQDDQMAQLLKKLETSKESA
ncbi:MAG: hypothetical protein ACD_64C00259G0003 [uncultured bacterium]|nr:MAG: hypothetical protein ACD_64C00259G0003 [uncultured bacterium]